MPGAHGGSIRLLGVHLGGRGCGFPWLCHARLDAATLPDVTIALSAVIVVAIAFLDAATLPDVTIVLTAIAVALSAAIVVAIAFVLVVPLQVVNFSPPPHAMSAGAVLNAWPHAMSAGAVPKAWRREVGVSIGHISNAR